MLKKCAVIAFVLMLAPTGAHADWLLTPSLGTTFGNSTRGNEHFTYGLSIGWMGAGIFGWEADLSYTPEFFQENDDRFRFVDDANVTSWMLNAIVGIPVGGQRGGGFRPYVSGGIGLMQYQQQSVDQLFDVDKNEFGVNLGGGAMGFVSDHVGLKGDLRYFNALHDPEPDNEFDVAVAPFGFWRGSVGLTFRW
jgi:opacity protein-like surface antigen